MHLLHIAINVICKERVVRSICVSTFIHYVFRGRAGVGGKANGPFLV